MSLNTPPKCARAALSEAMVSTLGPAQKQEEQRVTAISVPTCIIANLRHVYHGC